MVGSVDMYGDLPGATIYEAEYALGVSRASRKVALPRFENQPPLTPPVGCLSVPHDRSDGGHGRKLTVRIDQRDNSENSILYDLLIKGGEVVDPGSGFSGQLDVAINGGKIAAVEAEIDPSTAAKVIDATGQFVTPGLIDLHTHVYWGSTFWGIEPDPVAARIRRDDLAGCRQRRSYIFPGISPLHRRGEQSRGSSSLLNLSSIGLIGPTWEFANLDYLRCRSGANDHRGEPGRHPRGQSAHRFEHHARASASSRSISRASWPTRSICR